MQGIASQERRNADGKRVIAVVMKAVDANGVGSYKARFDATRALFDYGFSQFSEVEFVPAGYQFEDQKTLDVHQRKEKTVAIAVKEPIRMMVKTNEKDLYVPELVLDESLLKDGALQAPIKKGTVVGHVKLVKTEGTDYGFIDCENLGMDVVMTEDCRESRLVLVMMSAIGDFFAGIWDSATGFVKGLFK